MPGTGGQGVTEERLRRVLSSLRWARTAQEGGREGVLAEEEQGQRCKLGKHGTVHRKQADRCD